MRLHFKTNKLWNSKTKRKQKSSLLSSRAKIMRVVIRVTVQDVRHVPVFRNLVPSLDSRAVTIAVKNKKRAASVLKALELV